MIEEWRPVVGYEGLYEVSNTGIVRSVDRYVKTCYEAYKLHKGKILSPGKSKLGYLQVSLCNNGKIHQIKIHRLVAQAFLPNPDNLPEVNHRDENPGNNNVDNLEWCTRKYNVNYGTRNIRAKETAIKNGSWSGLSRKEYKKKYNEDNKESIKEYMKKYDQDNKESIKEYRKKWYQENTDKLKEYRKKWYQENKDRICERQKEYYLKRKEQIQNNV